MQKTWRSHLLVSYALAVLAFLYLPILILALYSFNDSRMNAVWAGFTFKWYSQLFNNRHVAEALANTLIIGFISTAVSTILGTTAALALHKYRYKYRGILNGFIYLPILIPEIVMGLSLLVLFSQIHLSLGRTSIILAHITFCLSFVVITVGARLDGLKQEYKEAPATCTPVPGSASATLRFPSSCRGSLRARSSLSHCPSMTSSSASL